jgi:hypothetical protein
MCCTKVEEQDKVLIIKLKASAFENYDWGWAKKMPVMKSTGLKPEISGKINCPDLKVGAIEKQSVTGLLPQASLRGAQNHQF